MIVSAGFDAARGDIGMNDLCASVGTMWHIHSFRKASPHNQIRMFLLRKDLPKFTALLIFSQRDIVKYVLNFAPKHNNFNYQVDLT